MSSAARVRALVIVVTAGTGLVPVACWWEARHAGPGGAAADQRAGYWADFWAAALLGWVVVLAGCTALVVRRLGDLDRASRAEEQPRVRLSGIAHRTSALLAEPDGLTMAQQPIIDVESGRCVGVEALARFHDGPSPDRWFTEAHEVGAGLALERLAVQKALALLPQIPQSIHLSINASPALVVDPAFHRALTDLGNERSRIVVEITEHAAVAGYEHIRAALTPHREVGLRLAVDDTGAGYASFAHVLRLRPEIIKLDRSLLSDIHEDAARRAFVTAIVLMALELDACVTAEGVETAVELEALRMLAVDRAQGYLLARPSTDPAVWRTWWDRDWHAHTGLTTDRGAQRVR